MTWASSDRNVTTLVFEEQVKVDVRVVRPRDVKKMLLKQARMVNWKKWAAKHEYEELKEGVWAGADPSYALKNDSDAWTVKHRHVVSKLVVENDVCRTDYTTLCWSDEKKCGGWNTEGAEGHRLYRYPSWREARNLIPETTGTNIA